MGLSIGGFIFTFCSAIIPGLIAYGIQRSWQSFDSRTDEVTLAIGRIYSVSDEYHRIISQLIISNADIKPMEEGQSGQIELTELAVNKTSQEIIVKNFFADHDIYAHAAMAKYGMTNPEIANLTREILLSMAKSRFYLWSKAMTPAAMLKNINEQISICDAMEGRVNRAISKARADAQFLNWLKSRICQIFCSRH